MLRGYFWALAVSLIVVSGCRDVSAPIAAPPLPLAASAQRLAPPLHLIVVDGGFSHTCGLAAGGAAYCWGDNKDGELGNGTRLDSRVPVAVAGGLSFVSLSVGAGHSCGLTAAGTAYCWGGNTSGQLGDGTETNRDVPVPVFGSPVFSEVSAGGAHSCGLKTSGAAYCWGDDFYGQLGDGRSGPGVKSVRPVAVVGGLSFSALAVGIFHNCALMATGRAYCWGNNDHGELGTGAFFFFSAVPVAVTGGLRFAAVDAGYGFTCGLTAAGAANCWGGNSLGQLGIGNSTGPQTCVFAEPCSTSPIPVVGGLTFARVAMGSDHICGLTVRGVAVCWGSNNNGQLGIGTNTGPQTCGGSPCSTVPIRVTGGLTFGSVGAGSEHSCALTTAGAAYCWGWNWKGQLGIGESAMFVPRPTPVSAP